MRTEKTNESEPLMRCRESAKTSKPGLRLLPGISLGGTCLLLRRRPAYRRRELGPGCWRERGNLSSRCQGRTPSVLHREGESTDAGHRGGTPRSSDEAQ